MPGGYDCFLSLYVYADRLPAVSFLNGSKEIVTVQPCDWQKREIEKVFSSDYPHGNT